ncbi:hypothetical protein TGRH88_054040 [Toxoplasma gondii]|uniref:Uncharacterized protein n=1 Tax=Toxoplasma gondii TaxID=5811 RepID=A0A7J6JZ10_TOXGO|nr:hypothetical protein TGRH88_054040 [Toxoplasma gondii]
MLIKKAVSFVDDYDAGAWKSRAYDNTCVSQRGPSAAACKTQPLAWRTASQTFFFTDARTTRKNSRMSASGEVSTDDTISGLAL